MCDEKKTARKWSAIFSQSFCFLTIPFRGQGASRRQCRPGRYSILRPYPLPHGQPLPDFWQYRRQKMQHPLLIQRKESHGRWSSHLPSVPSSAEQRLSLHPLFRRHPGMSDYLFQPAVAAGRIHDFFDLGYDFFFCHKNHPFCSNII